MRLSLLFAFLIAAIPLLSGCDDAHRAGRVVVARVDEAIALLKTLPRPAPAAPDAAAAAIALPDYLEVRRALRRGDAAPLRAYLPQLVSAYDQGRVDETKLEQGLRPLQAVLPEAISALDAWVTEAPRENAAYLARGIVRTQQAFEERGTEPYMSLRREDYRRMHEWHARAAEDMQASIKLSRRPLPAIRQLIGIARVSGGMRKRAHTLFDEGNRLEQTSSLLYYEYDQHLHGRWGSNWIAPARDFMARAIENGIDHDSWGTIQHTLYNADHDNVFWYDKQAKLRYEIALTKQYDSYHAWFLRYVAEREMGLLEDAARSLERAAERRPDQLDIVEERARLLQMRKMIPEALAEFERAAKMESAWAYHTLLYAYATGKQLGVKIDMAKVRRLAEESAALHQPEGEHYLSWLLLNGMAGFASDEPRAMQLELDAARHGRVPSATLMGHRLYVGMGIEADRAEAMYWLRRAARHNDKDAIELLSGFRHPLYDALDEMAIVARLDSWLARMDDR